MLFEIMKHIKNFFPVRMYEGAFKITNGMIDLPRSFVGKYILIEGSALNDGVYNMAENMRTWELMDEEFNGCVIALSPPKSFLNLVNDIEKWAADDSNKAGAYVSESFGGYSYTKATNANGTPAGWQEVFGSRLNTWRKL